MNSNPRRGPFHYKAPARILWRTIRGMIPYKTARGAAAMDRLRTFEGIPNPYDRMKKMVVPAALKVLRLKPHRNFCRLGDLSTHNGWKYNELIEKLETSRKKVSAARYQKKVKVEALFKEAKQKVTMENTAGVDPQYLKDMLKEYDASTIDGPDFKAGGGRYALS